jgi:hypothetical protein
LLRSTGKRCRDHFHRLIFYPPAFPSGSAFCIRGHRTKN